MLVIGLQCCFCLIGIISCYRRQFTQRFLVSHIFCLTLCQLWWHFLTNQTSPELHRGGRITPHADTMEPVVAKYANIIKQHRKNITAHVISIVRKMIKSNISWNSNVNTMFSAKISFVAILIVPVACRLTGALVSWLGGCSGSFGKRKHGLNMADSSQIGLLRLPDMWMTPREHYGGMFCFSCLVLYIVLVSVGILSLCETLWNLNYGWTTTSPYP